MTETKKPGTKSTSGYSTATVALDDEPFFTEIEALSRLYANETEATNRTKIKLLRKLPMLIPEDFDPLNTILICRNPEERILILKDMDNPIKRTHK